MTQSGASLSASWTSERPSGPTSTPSKPRPQKPHPPVADDSVVQADASPLQKLVSTAESGSAGSLASHATAFSATAKRLAGIAESAAGGLRRDTELAR